MNNSKLTIEQFNLDNQEIDRTPWLKEREGTLVKLVETLRRVAQSEDWSSLQKELFDGVVEALERQQKSEAEKDKPDSMVLAKINGQLVWARKYSDLKKLSDIFMEELKGVRKQLP